MRRIVIVCLLLLLPLQWSWAALGSSGSHECGCVTTHAGADACVQAAAEGPDGHCGDGAAGATCGTDCSDCHGQSHAGLLGVLAMTLPAAANASASDPAWQFRNHIPDHPLRPPLPQLP